MHVVTHNRVTEYINPIELSEINLTLFDPVTPVFIRFPTEFIDTTEHSSSDSPIYAVHD